MRLLALISRLVPILLLAGGTVLGQSQEAGASDESILFDAIPEVSGASRYEQSAAEAPASVTVITAEEIERYGYRTLADLLRTVRSFYASYDRNYTYVGVRGFSRPGDYNTRILLLVDGHRLNEQVFDAAYFGTEAPIDLSVLERVEVIRGPSSSLYGTNAFLAVVNLVTRRGRDLQGGEAAAHGGSFDTWGGSVALGGKLASGFEGLFAASVYRSGGQDLYFDEFDIPPSDGVARSADEDEYWRTFGKASYGSFSLEGGFTARSKQIPTASYETIFGDPRSRTRDARGYATLAYGSDVAAETRLEASLSYDMYRYDGTYAYAPTAFKDYGNGTWWTANAQALTERWKRHKIVGGFEYRKNTQQDQGGYDVDPSFVYLEDRRRSTSWALFAQDEIRLHDDLLLNLGLRHDRYDSFGSSTNPRLALIYGQPESFTLKALYGSAFRSPNIYELYYDDGGVSQKENPELEPETIRTYELELGFALGGELRAMVSLFHYTMDDLISQTTDPADDLLQFQNLDGTRATGAEIEIGGRLAKVLDGRLSYGYQDSSTSGEDEDPVNSPTHLAKLNLSAPFVRERLFGSLDAQYTSQRRTIGGEEAPAYTLVNATLLLKLAGERLSLSGSVYNIFDEEYGDPAGGEHAQVLIPQDGRSYRMQVRYAF